MTYVTRIASAAILLAASFGTAQAMELKWVGCDTASEGFARQLADSYGEADGDSFRIEAGGSTRGLADVSAGLADLGCATRHKISQENAQRAKLLPIAWDALVVITHSTNPVRSVSVPDLMAVLEGKIRNWKALGGPDKSIELLLRKDDTSGVGVTLREYLFSQPNHQLSANAILYGSAEELETATEERPYALAVTEASRAVRRNVAMLGIDQTPPSHDTIMSGNYPFAHPVYLVVPKQRRPEIRAFVKFVTGEEGQEIIKQSGLIGLATGSTLWGAYQQRLLAVRKKARP